LITRLVATVLSYASLAPMDALRGENALNDLGEKRRRFAQAAEQPPR
jgi:hypothetical protein